MESQQAQPHQQNGVQPAQSDNHNGDQIVGYGSEMKVIEEKVIDKRTGAVTIKKYSKGKLLGSGGFAKCYEVISQDTKAVLAAKIIPKSTLTKNRQRVKLISEIKIHKSLHNKNIVQFEHVFEDAENVYILLELCPYQTLNELIRRRKRITEFETQVYVMQIVQALKYLHANKVIHRDLKLGNLFLGDNMTLKLGDFGLATKIDFEGEKKKTVCGTPNYIAPEILEGKDGHSYEVDMWSLGVIIYTLLIGKPPYETKDVRTTYARIKKNSYCFPESVVISENAKSLITSILNLNPTKRPTLDELLLHPFMQGTAHNPENLPISSLVVPYSKLKDAAALREKNSNGQTRSDSVGGNGKDMRGSTKSLTTSQNTEQFGKLSNNQNLRPSEQSAGAATSSQIPPASEIWVKQWVDYSSKYGLGYSLNNGTIGVHFNDSTKIVCDPTGMLIEYYEKPPTAQIGDEKQPDKFHSFTIDNYPAELKKKVSLLNHFRSFLESDIIPAASSSKQQQHAQLAAEQSTQPPPVYRVDPKTGKKALFFVKKWVKTKNSILFRLSNQIVQVNFSDRTEIILNSIGKTVTYRNLHGQRLNYPLNQTYNKYDHEMAKRLRYAKDILSDIISKNIPGQQQQQQQSVTTSNQNHLLQSQQSLHNFPLSNQFNPTSSQQFHHATSSQQQQQQQQHQHQQQQQQQFHPSASAQQFHYNQNNLQMMGIVSQQKASTQKFYA